MQKSATILLVDDEPDIITVLRHPFERAGFTLHAAGDGQAAWDYLQAHQPDLIVLDVIMPKLDGRELLRRLRQSGNLTPVILLTVVGNSTDRTMALSEGADDYLNKPFDPNELIARIRAVLWRVGVGIRYAASSELKSGPLSLKRTLRQVWTKGERKEPSSKAFDLLAFLMSHPGETFTAEQLLDAVWGWLNPSGTGALRTRIAELRRLLGDDVIETVPGRGYRFNGDVTRD